MSSSSVQFAFSWFVNSELLKKCTETNIKSVGTLIHVYVQTYRRTDVQTYSRTDVQTYSRTDVQTYRRTVVQTYSRTDVQSYSRTDVQSIIYISEHELKLRREF